MYELCTLKKAFQADNLLGLVFKIVSEAYEPIPNNLPYSKELRMLVGMLLEKKPENRPSVADILQMDIVKKKMLEFVKSGGMTIAGSKGIYVKNAPVLKPSP